MVKIRHQIHNAKLFAITRDLTLLMRGQQLQIGEVSALAAYPVRVQATVTDETAMLAISGGVVVRHRHTSAKITEVVTSEPIACDLLCRGRVSLTDSIDLTISGDRTPVIEYVNSETGDDFVQITWPRGKVEADIPGPINPDIEAIKITVGRITVVPKHGPSIVVEVEQ